MTEYPATAVLRAEHDNILQMIRVADAAADRLEAGGAVESSVLSGLVEVFRQYADRCHHAKEEDLLFPALEQKGFSVQEGPIAVMLYEHDNGRAFVREMAAAASAYAGGDTGAAARWAVAARQFGALLRAHIDKENLVLFVMAERMLTPDEQAKLAAAYAEVDGQRIGQAEHDRLSALMQTLNRAVEPVTT